MFINAVYCPSEAFCFTSRFLPDDRDEGPLLLGTPLNIAFRICTSGDGICYIEPLWTNNKSYGEVNSILRSTGEIIIGNLWLIWSYQMHVRLVNYQATNATCPCCWTDWDSAEQNEILLDRLKLPPCMLNRVRSLLDRLRSCWTDWDPAEQTEILHYFLRP